MVYLANYLRINIYAIILETNLTLKAPITTAADERRASFIKGLFCPFPPPPPEAKYKKNQPLVLISFNIRTITKVFKSQITLTFTVALVTKMASKMG